MYKKVLIFLAIIVATASSSEIDSVIFREEVKSVNDYFDSFKIAYEANEYCDALIYAKYISSFFLRYHEAEMYRKWKSVVDEVEFGCERMDR